MTPTASAAASSASGASAAASSKHNGRRGSTTRYSILSDPRLSQLFALSSQLEALAQSIDVQPPPPKTQPPNQQPQKNNNNNTMLLMSSSTPISATATRNNVNGGQNDVTGSELGTSVKYRRLKEDELENSLLVSSMTSEQSEAPGKRHRKYPDIHVLTNTVCFAKRPRKGPL